MFQSILFCKNGKKINQNKKSAKCPKKLELKYKLMSNLKDGQERFYLQMSARFSRAFADSMNIMSPIFGLGALKSTFLSLLMSGRLSEAKGSFI